MFDNSNMFIRYTNPRFVPLYLFHIGIVDTHPERNSTFPRRTLINFHYSRRIDTYFVISVIFDTRLVNARKLSPISVNYGNQRVWNYSAIVDKIIIRLARRAADVLQRGVAKSHAEHREKAMPTSDGFLPRIVRGKRLPGARH